MTVAFERAFVVRSPARSEVSVHVVPSSGEVYAFGDAIDGFDVGGALFTQPAIVSAVKTTTLVSTMRRLFDIGQWSGLTSARLIVKFLIMQPVHLYVAEQISRSAAWTARRGVECKVAPTGTLSPTFPYGCRVAPIEIHVHRVHPLLLPARVASKEVRAHRVS